MKINSQLDTRLLLQIFVGVVYGIGCVWWLYVHFTHSVDTLMNYWFNVPMALSPSIIGAALIYQSISLYRHTRSMQYHVLYFGLYLLLWGIGTFSALVYNIILHVEIPYPSFFGDLIYFISQLSVLTAMFLFVSHIQQWRDVKKIIEKIVFFATAPILQLALYWCVMHLLDKSPFPGVNVEYVYGVMVLVVNTGTFLLLYIFAYVLIFQSVRKELRMISWLLVAGVTMQYITDYYFIRLLNVDAFFVGSFVDFLYLTTYAFMSFVGAFMYKKLA